MITLSIVKYRRKKEKSLLDITEARNIFSF
jgi:hypothetical protein